MRVKDPLFGSARIAPVRGRSTDATGDTGLSVGVTVGTLVSAGFTVGDGGFAVLVSADDILVGMGAGVSLGSAVGVGLAAGRLHPDTPRVRTMALMKNGRAILFMIFLSKRQGVF